MISLKHLISHRFRGFSEHENTIKGLNAALDFGVLNLEFDIRVTRCGTPMIYHDEYAHDGGGDKRFISHIMARDFAALGGTFSHIPTADALLRAASQHTNKDAKLLIDIKDAGFEAAIHALVRQNHLQDRVVYVSWVPNALYALHDIAPEMPLCFSHWCQSPNEMIRYLHKTHLAKDGIIPRLSERYIHGERSGWFVKGGVKGRLRDMLIQTGGSICVPQDMMTEDLVARYHADNIQVSTFSYVGLKDVNAHQKQLNIDLYFIDNKAVFDDL